MSLRQPKWRKTAQNEGENSPSFSVNREHNCPRFESLERRISKIQQSIFIQTARRFVEAYQEIEGANLKAVYLFGSVFRGEASLGYSDIDLHAFVESTPNFDKHVPIQAKFEIESPGIIGFAMPMQVQPAKENKYLAFRIRWDSLLLTDGDVFEGIPTPEADRTMAKELFPSVLELANFASGRIDMNSTDFDLPTDGLTRHRKLARLAVLGGACLQMALGRFKSYRGVDVLPDLLSSYPQWSPFLHEVEGSYISPNLNESDLERQNRFTQNLSEFLGWVDSQI